MRSGPGAAPHPARRISIGSLLLMLGAAAAGVLPTVTAAAERPQAAVILERLCTDRLRANEEDRLYGMISLTVRATIKYQGGVFSPDLIDDAVQDGLGELLANCARLAGTDDPLRLGMAVELIRNATYKRLADADAGYSSAQTEKATAADLSQELSSPEIDAWLGALPPRQRTLALFLYASGLSRDEIAQAAGLPPHGVSTGFREVKANLLKFYRQEWESPPPPPLPRSPALEYREADQDLASLLTRSAATPPATSPAPAPASPAPPHPRPRPDIRITGISSDFYAGWSLLATVTGLPADRRLEIAEPVLLVPDAPGRRRMAAVAAEEISDPKDATRRFLIKAFAIDAELDGSGLHDTFHLGAAGLDNQRARETLRNRSLAAIEVAHCLWYDYGTAPDPGLCR
jgi:DNA-directed RNA polymerase specialized sigma24 family protein